MSNSLKHYGIKGQEWGVRNYQYEDGTLTPAGKERYSDAGRQAGNMANNGLRLRTTSTVTAQRRTTTHPAQGSAPKPMNDPQTIQYNRKIMDEELKRYHESGFRNNFAYMQPNDFEVFLGESGIDTDGMTPQQIQEELYEFNKRNNLPTEYTEEDSKRHDDDVRDKWTDEMADRVIRGELGNGEERKRKLGNRYAEVQKRVNEKLSHSDIYTDELTHFGVKGMKWGVRRYQNTDGTLTALGKKRKAGREEYIKRITDEFNRTQGKLIAQRDRYSKLKSDISKRGANGEFKKNLRISKDDSGRTSYWNAIELDDGDEYKSKKEAYDAYKNHVDRELDYYTRNTSPSKQKQLNKTIDKIRKTPISERTYIENEKLGKRTAKTAMVGIAALGSTAIVASHTYLLGLMIGFPITCAASVVGGMAAGMTAENIGVKKEYRREEYEDDIDRGELLR